MTNELSSRGWVVKGEELVAGVREKTPKILRAIEVLASKVVAITTTVQPTFKIR